MDEEQIYTYLTSAGMAPHQAAGVLANFRQESAMNPGAVNPSSGAYGLAQWLGPRKRALEEFSRSRGSSMDNARTQLDFLLSELNGPERSAGQALMAAKTPEEAALAVSRKYERAGKNESMDGKRASNARSILEGMIGRYGMRAMDAAIPAAQAADTPQEYPGEGLQDGGLSDPAEFGGKSAMQADDGLSDPSEFGGKSAQTVSQPTYNPTNDMTGGERFLAGMGKSFVDTGRAIGQAGRTILPDGVSDTLGLPTQADIDEAKRLDEPLMQTGGGLAGNVAGTVAQSFVPGAALKATKVPGLVKAGQALMVPKSVKGSMLAGGIMGAVQPVASDESVWGNIAAGEIGGGLGSLAGKGLSRVLSPRVSKDVQSLIDAGVKPTIGQTLGGGFQRVEDKLAGTLPIVGDAINNAREKALNSFNEATADKVLKPVGEKLTGVKPGYDMVRQAATQVSGKYESLLPKLKVAVDGQFDSEISSLRGLADGMADPQRSQFNRILDQDVLGRFTPEGNMLGDTMKKVDTKLGKMIRQYGASQGNPDHWQLADALRETQSILRNLVERSNPQHAGELGKINSAFKRLAIMERAAGMRGAKDGVFTGAQLSNSSKAFDSSIRKKATAHGKATMQDWAESGEKVLGQKVPDSGTAGRIAAMMGTGGAAYWLEPTSLAGFLGGAALYSHPVQSVLRAAVTKRPPGFRSLADFAETLGGKLGGSLGPRELEDRQLTIP